MPVGSVDLSLFFFFNDTATTEIYTLSLHDALPISLTALLLTSLTSPHNSCSICDRRTTSPGRRINSSRIWNSFTVSVMRSEEHTSELQSRLHLVCRLLLEKKKKTNTSGSVVRRPMH